MKKIPAITILLIANLTLAIPQEYDFYDEQQYIREDYDNEWVYCLLHDSTGFMWFAERAGLYRYDGYSFKSYYHQGTDSTSLSDNQIITLREGLQGDIWIGTMGGGLNRYNREKDNFTRYPLSQDDPYNLRNAAIWAICVRRSGVIWFSAHSILSQGIYALDPAAGHINPVLHDTINPGHFGSYHTRSILEDSRGDMWTGDAGGLHRFDNTKGFFLHYSNDPDDPNSISNDTVTTIFEDRSGTLWIGSYNGLNQYDREGEQFTRHIHEPGNPNSLNDNLIGTIIEDHDGNLIINTTVGINFLDKQKNNFTNWKYTKPLLPDFNPKTEYNTAIGLRSLDVDARGTVWYAVYGFHKLIREKNSFIYLRTGQNFFTPSCICEDNKGDIWVSTWGNYGLYRISAERLQGVTGGIQHIPFDETKPVPGLYHYGNDPDYPNHLDTELIISICQDRQGTMWFGGGESGTLYKLDPSEEEEEEERFVPYTYTSETDSGFTQWNLTRIYEDRGGNLWVGGKKGLEIFDRDREMFIPFDMDPEKLGMHSSHLINAICEDDSGAIWVGTWRDGLIKIVPPVTISNSDTGYGFHTVSYEMDPGLPKDLGDHPITTLCSPKIRKTAELWIGTMGGGIFGLIRDKSPKRSLTERFVHYTMDDGLPNNTVYGLLDDEHGNLWIATTNGLCKFEPASGEFRIYDESDGMPVRSFPWLSGHKGKNGKLFFSAEGGLISFHPDSIKDNPFVPPVVITEFSMFNEPVPMGDDSPLNQPINETSELELSFDQNYISFEYAALNYINTERNRYKYKMDGLDRDWINAGDQRMASYSNLKPGRYTFRVIGSNDDGVWNEEGTSLGIIIHPPPWRTWWAYAIYGLVVIALIMCYRNFLVSRERLKADLQLEKIEVEKVQELDRMKSRFFANISHEFRTPLTLILGPIDRLLANRPKVTEFDWNLFRIMKRNAEKLKALINQILDLSKLDTGQAKLQVYKGNITEFLKNIVLSYLSLADSKTINYQYDLARAPADLYFDGDKLEKIAGNLISNAFKFTPEGGRISVKLQYIMNVKDNVPEYLELSVKDSGIGIPVGKLDKIFNRYYQVDDPEAGMQEGSGLGLSLTKELVDLYRGKINVDSIPGKGSTFTVRLPVKKSFFEEDEMTVVKGIEKEETYLPEPETTVEEIIATNNDHIVSSQDIRNIPVVLIVEDNHDLRKFIIQGMDDLYQILEAENGLVGLNRAIEEIPDLVITDLMMPEMDGLEMCKRLKTDERTSHIPVIILTARADRASKLEGLESYADDYMIKPFDQEELKARARNLIEQRRLLREKFKYDFFIKERGLDLKSTDERFIQKAIETVKSHLDDPDFKVKALSEILGVSSMQLYRKIHGLTNQSPSEFIRNLRLQHSVLLLKKNFDNIAQIAYQVGFSSHSYYTKCFRELYGLLPVEYVKSQTGIQLSDTNTSEDAL